MERRPFGWTGEMVPVIGQGTWNLEHDRAAAIRTLRRGVDLGMTHIDTAEMYGGGRVEAIIADALGERRDELFLVSKVLPQNASYQGTIAACERSLRALRTDRLDCYLLHWPGRHPLVDTIAAFERLVADGKIRYYGVSNFDRDEVARAVAIAGERRIACNQVLYHLGERYVEGELVPLCEQHGIAVVGYSPFGSGKFPSPSSAGGKVLQAIAAAHGATARQVALRFLVRRPSMFTIPRAGSPEHAAENAGAADLALDEAELRRIAEAFPPRPRRSIPSL